MAEQFNIHAPLPKQSLWRNVLKEKLHTAQGWICRFKKAANSDVNSAIQLCTHRYRSCTISAMQLNTLPETPAQAMPALETTEGEQEDMLACALQTKKIPFSSRLWRLLWNAGLASGTYICTINDCSVERVYTSTIDCMYIHLAAHSSTKQVFRWGVERRMGAWLRACFASPP